MQNHHSFAHADAPRRRGAPPAMASCIDSEWAGATSKPMKAGDSERLIAWFSGGIGLTRSEAHRLLDAAVESGDIAQYRAEFVAAIKALAVGPRHWQEVGYRLLPDD